MTQPDTATTAKHPHISQTDQGVAIIEGTTMKVIEIVLAKRSYGWTPEEIQINHRYLSMGQIHAALAYYWDNKQALDNDIEARERLVSAQESEAGESSFATRLRVQGLVQ